MNTDHILPPHLAALADRELSLSSRLAHSALMLVALTITVLLGALWWTEPAPLPLRTQIGFGAMMLAGAGWVIFALWGLTVRRTLLVRHALVASTMGAVFSAALLAGGVALTLGTGNAAGHAFTVLGIVLLAVALTLRARASRRLRSLLARRAELERQMS